MTVDRITALEEALSEAGDVMSGIADHLLQHKNEPHALNQNGMFADLQRGGMAARAALTASRSGITGGLVADIDDPLRAIGGGE